MVGGTTIGGLHWVDLLLPRVSYLSLPSVAFDFCFIDSSQSVALISTGTMLGVNAILLGAIAESSVTAETNSLDIWYFIMPIVVQFVFASFIVLFQIFKNVDAGNPMWASSHGLQIAPTTKLQAVALNSRSPLWAHVVSILLKEEAHSHQYVIVNGYLVEWATDSSTDEHTEAKLFDLAVKHGEDSMTWDDRQQVTNLAYINGIRGGNISVFQTASAAVGRLPNRRQKKEKEGGLEGLMLEVADLLA